MKQLLTAFFCLIASLAFSQQWTTYTMANTSFGLSSDVIHCVVIDSHNNKWVGTQYGVCRYDGTTWTQYNIFNSSDVYSLAIDQQGNILAGGGNGVRKYDGTSWTSLGLLGKWIQSITFDAQGNVWVGTAFDGAMKYDGTNWTAYNHLNSSLSDDAVYAVTIDPQGAKWFGTDSGANKLSGTNWTSYNSHFSLSPAYAIVIDGQGTAWFGLNGSVQTFDGTNWASYYYSNSGLPNGMQVGAIAIDAHGSKWFGSGNSLGVTRYDGTTWTTYTTLNSGLPNDFVNSIAVDGQGTYWLGTNGGLSKLSGLPSGIESTLVSNQPAVYPTVTNGVIHIAGLTEGVCTITVYDLLGKAVQTEPPFTTSGSPVKTIDVSNLTNGIYVVDVLLNGLHSTKKIVVGH